MSEQPDTDRPREEKVTKEDASYKKGTPFHRCGLCEYMHGHECDIVAGWIEPYMGCKYFERKGAKKDKD